MIKNIKFSNFDNTTGEGIYLIRNKNNNLLKIGLTNDINRRIKDIKSNFKFFGEKPNLELECFIECDNNFEVEKYLHKRFDKYRYTNEWFDIKYISDIISSLINEFVTTSSVDKNITKEIVNRSMSLYELLDVPFPREYQGEIIKEYNSNDIKFVSESEFGIPTLREYAIFTSILYIYMNKNSKNGIVEYTEQQILRNMCYENNPSNVTRKKLSESIDILTNTTIEKDNIKFKLLDVKNGILYLSEFVIKEIENNRIYTFIQIDKNFISRRISSIIEVKKLGVDELTNIIPSINLEYKYNKRDIKRQLNKII